MQIDPIHAFSDNYIWCLHDGRNAVVVDPGDAAPVIEHCREQQLTLREIWITHHHPDHVGGVAALRHQWPDLTVVAPAGSPFRDADRALHEGDTLTAFDTRFRVIAVPGHTLDHLAFAAEAAQPPLLFCGDTLFAGGCGRLFEGSAEQMHASLQKLATLPPQTRVHCAHEYTLANLVFALAVEPANAALRERQQDAERLRAADRPTVPSTLAQELATNPFLRCDQPAVIAAAATRGGNATPVSVFAAIRRWKDHF